MSILVYIKPDKHTEVYDRQVSLGQVAQVLCRDRELEMRCKERIVLQITENREAHYVLSVMDLVAKIQEIHPQVEVINLGESDLIVGYLPKPRRRGIDQWIKTALVCLIVFFGGAFAIMTFNNDGSVSQIFQDIDRLVLGTGKEMREGTAEEDASDQDTSSTDPAGASQTKTTGVWILEISYSVGLVLGVTIFFNHFGKRKITLDPTPIEVQMRLYEDQVGTTVIQNASRKESGIDAK